MAMKGKYPQVGKAKEIGARAKRCFSANHPDAWFPTDLSGDEDFGYDYQIQLQRDGEVVSTFRAQLKGSESPQLSADGTRFSVKLRASTVRLYSNCTEAIMLVLADVAADSKVANCPLYFAWIQDELRRLNNGELSEDAEYVTFHVQSDQRLTEDTDISPKLEQLESLAHVGQALDLAVERADPGLSSLARADIVNKIPSGLSRSSPSLITTLAEDSKDPWPQAPKGTFPWHLAEAAAELRRGNVEDARVHLEAAGKMGRSNSLERANLAFLRGRVHTLNQDDARAKVAYQEAIELSGRLDKYVIAWAEAEVCLRYDVNEKVDFSDLIGQLSGDAPAIVGMRARLLAAQGDLDDALSLALAVPGAEGFVARTMVRTMRSELQLAEAAATEGLSLSDLAQGPRVIMLILRARARFNMSVTAHMQNADDEIIPPSGPAGTDIETLKLAWEDICNVVGILRKSGWGPNVDIIADVWAATAAILGQQLQVLPLMIEASLSGPRLPMMQQAVETTATLLHDFDSALQANGRRPYSPDKVLKRVSLLHFAKQHPQCVELFEKEGIKMPREEGMFYSAAIFAIQSAEKLVRPGLAATWRKELAGDERFRARTEVMQFFQRIEKNLLDKDQALADLWEQYESLNRPLEMAMLLLMEMETSDDAAAERAVALGGRIMSERLLPEDLSLSYCQALAQLRRWRPLLDYARATLQRVSRNERIKAVEALALDRLGRTADAVVSLRQLVSAGSRDRFAINTYVNIVMRCGLEGEAIQFVESMVSTAQDRRQKIEALRMLFVLVHHSKPTDARSIDIAWNIGELVDQKIEEEEGLFLILMFSAVLNAQPSSDDSRLPRFRNRMNEFIKRFPDSRILKAASFPTSGTGAQMMAIIQRATGWSESRDKNRQRLFNQMQRGAMPIPYAWRPRRILLNVPDVPSLWETTKRDRTREPAYQLTMANGAWRPKKLKDIRRQPLLDLVSLLVLYDLDALPLLFKVFDRIAIAQATLHELSQLVAPMSGCPFRGKCADLREILKQHLNQITQPWIPTDGGPDSIGSHAAAEQIRGLVETREYELYSDDLFFRVYALEETESPGMCTLDFLGMCEQKGLLSVVQVGEKYSRLMSWNVGMTIQLRYQLAVLPEGLSSANSVNDAVDLLRASDKAAAVFDAIWHTEKSLEELRRHGAAVLRNTINDENNSVVSISALMALWFGKVRLHPGAKVPPQVLLAQVMVVAAAPVGSMTSAIAQRLWSVYLQLVEFHYGNSMDREKENEAIRELGKWCALLDHRNQQFEEKSLRNCFARGLTENTSTYAVFWSGYCDALSEAVKSMDK